MTEACQRIGPDVSDLVVLMAQDHRAITETCAMLADATSRSVSALLRRLLDQLLRHELAEEAVFYPELLTLAGGQIVAERLMSEQRLLEQQVLDLEATIANPARLRTDLSPRQLSSSLLRHLETEEGIAFPLIVTGLHRTRLQDLGARYVEIRETRPRLRPGIPPVDGGTDVGLVSSGGVATLFGSIHDCLR